MKNNVVKIITIMFLCFVPVWMLVCRDKSFSEKENRRLASFPKLTWDSLTSGAFMKDTETYLSDQFPLRDAAVSLKTTALRMTGQRKINGVYIAKDGYLIAEEAEYDSSRLDALVTSVNSFADSISNVSKVSMMLVPNSVTIYEDKLPYKADSGQQGTITHVKNELSENVNFIDTYDTLAEHKNIGVFYKTDHHWTTRGAYYAFLQYAQAEGIDTAAVNYDFYNVTGDFQGTQSSNSGVYSSRDYIEICVPHNSEGSYVVNYVENTVKSATLFDMEKLEEKDKYQVFLGGNYSQVDISTNAGTGRNLMLIKDSYANCMIPMLTPFYDKIVVIDPRYFYDDINEVMSINKINEVLFLYNVDSFVEDNSLADIINIQ